MCENVCDKCNLFFGQHYQGSPSVETVLKETFNISRIRLIDKDEIGKNKTLTKFSSQYFKLDAGRRNLELKQSYQLQTGFQERIGRQMKKGLYKIYLEEVERQTNKGHDQRYDFIREFCRYNIGDYPVIYFERLYGMIVLSKSWAIRPQFFLDESHQFKYLVREPGFFEFEFLGHVFAIAKSRFWEISFDNYIRESMLAKKELFNSWRFIKSFNDVDLALRILDKG